MELENYPDAFFCVVYRGNLISIVNRQLAQERQLSTDTVEKIKRTHVFVHVLLDMMAEESKVESLPIYEVVFRNTLFYQQSLWKFDLIESFHDWNHLPRCICPHRPQGYIHTIDKDCPVHHKRYVESIDKYMTPILDKKISSAKL